MPVNAAVSGWVVEGYGDFNGDGKADVFWRNSTTGATSAWLMDGDRMATFASYGPVSNALTAYMRDCQHRGVPIPPDWDHKTGAMKWVFQGPLSQNLLGKSQGKPNEFAGVWAYSDPIVRGACIALPRGDGKTGTPLGIICQSAITGQACFWDNKRADDPDQNFLGWAKLRLSIAELADGSNLKENCTGCHRGNNVFLISPDDPTWAKLLRGPLEGTRTGTFTTKVEAS